MLNILINTEEYSLPFLKDDDVENKSILNSEEENDEELDSTEKLYQMENSIPDDVIYLGSIETEINNWTSWDIEDYYYIMKLVDDEYNWALFRITWDDNWGSWEWSPDARLKLESKNPYEAAILILKNIWEKWEIDYRNLNSPYKLFIDKLENDKLNVT